MPMESERGPVIPRHQAQLLIFLEKLGMQLRCKMF